MEADGIRHTGTSCVFIRRLYSNGLLRLVDHVNELCEASFPARALSAASHWAGHVMIFDREVNKADFYFPIELVNDLVQDSLVSSTTWALEVAEFGYADQMLVSALARGRGKYALPVVDECWRWRRRPGWPAREKFSAHDNHSDHSDRGRQHHRYHAVKIECQRRTPHKDEAGFRTLVECAPPVAASISSAW